MPGRPLQAGQAVPEGLGQNLQQQMARKDSLNMALVMNLKGAIGKGGRSPAVREAFAKHRAVYFLAVGGAGALLSKQVRSVEVVAYEDLGTEAIRRIRVEDFPAIVCNDIYGADALQQGKAQWRREEILHPKTAPTS